MSTRSPSGQTMDIGALQRSLREFAAERDWQPFHTPKNLAMALMVEAAELAEIFQWLTPEQSTAARGDTLLQQRAGEEVADVLLYLLQIADHLGIDLKRAVGRKLSKNAVKHPPKRGGGTIEVSAEPPPPTHALVDWENVQPDEATLRSLVPGVSDAWVFHGPSQRGIASRFEGFGDQATLVPIARSGKNALDFHLAFYMGYIAARQPGARFVVVSNDKGYGPMIEHAAALGFLATQVEPGAKAPRKRASPKPRAAAPKAGPKKAGGRSAAPAPPAAEEVQKPARKRGRRAPDPVAATAKTAAVAATVKAAAPAPAPAAAPAPTPASAPAPAPKPRAPRRAARAPDPPGPEQRALEGLRRHADRPARRASLLRMIGSLLGPTADAQAAEAVLARLIADGHVAVDARGAVRYSI